MQNSNKHSDDQSDKKVLWEKIFSAQYTFIKRFIFAAFMAFLGFGICYSLYNLTNNYIPSVTMIAVVIIALVSGLQISLLFASLLALVNDYFFIPPIGSVLNNLQGVEHLFILLGLTIFISYIGSSLRLAFQKTINAKLEAESASFAMERVLALISHDIRNPLAALRINAQLILKTPDQHIKQLIQ